MKMQKSSALGSFVPGVVQKAIRSQGANTRVHTAEHLAVMLHVDAAFYIGLAQKLTDDRGSATFLSRAINSMFTNLLEQIRECGGDVVKFPGDSCTMIWLMHPDATELQMATVAKRALNCAQKMHKVMLNQIMGMDSDTKGKKAAEGEGDKGLEATKTLLSDIIARLPIMLKLVDGEITASLTTHLPLILADLASLGEAGGGPCPVPKSYADCSEACQSAMFRLTLKMRALQAKMVKHAKLAVLPNLVAKLYVTMADWDKVSDRARTHLCCAPSWPTGTRRAETDRPQTHQRTDRLSACLLTDHQRTD
jgi:hypothetical protein